MTEKKQVRKNPSPLVVKGTFYVTATFEDKQYVVSNGLSFLRFKKDGEEINKGDYVEIHGPIYQKKEAAHPIITGEAVVRKLTEAEVDEYKAKLAKALRKADPMLDAEPKKEKKTKTTKATEQKMPWE
jgi:TfoX/Sxy family transcriptional regulator of competence genes